MDWQDGMAIVSALKAEGMPEAVCCMQGLMEGFDYSSGMGGSGSVGRHADMKHTLQAAAESAIAGDVKCIQEENGAIIIRTISVCIPRDISWRASRSYLVSDSVEISPPTDPTQPTRTIKVTGYLRGTPMRLHSLMYVAGVGACRVVSVQGAVSPFDSGRKQPAAPAEIVYADASK